MGVVHGKMLAMHPAPSLLSEAPFDILTTAGALATAVPPIAADMACAAVYERFVGGPEPAIVVIDPDQRPVGLVSRHTVLARFAARYGPELFGRKPIALMMDDRPLIVDETTPINELGRQVAVENPTALVHGFIVTAGGRYRGIGTGHALIRCKVEQDARRTLELKTALVEAATARQAMSNFLAMMSHELRTPLNAIIGFSDVLQREQFGPLGRPRYVEYARDIHGAGSHLLSLISDILDLSKVQAGRLELHEQPVELGDVVGAAVRLVAERAQTAMLSLSTDIPGDLPPLIADELRLKQMLINLLSNAIKFTLPGGSVKVAARFNGEEIVVRVTDTGVGIAPEDIPTAFAVFGQVGSPTTRRPAEGTGLGLPLVKALTELHGGRFVLESTVGVGTAATMIFPRERIVAFDTTAGAQT
ncbi:MAG TPA: ATP-binding protein [Alphaproteobacteria bacterium]|nr:ATP-binding protein [Alphaproteobacteria bacterium]